MGAQDFTTQANGTTAKQAFRSATEQARFEHGHGGYTGSVAEKYEFVMIDCPVDRSPKDFAWELILDNDSRISDKYGPAGCIKIDKETYLFFGSASC